MWTLRRRSVFSVRMPAWSRMRLVSASNAHSLSGLSSGMGR